MTVQERIRALVAECADIDRKSAAANALANAEARLVQARAGAEKAYRAYRKIRCRSLEEIRDELQILAEIHTKGFCDTGDRVGCTAGEIVVFERTQGALWVVCGVRDRTAELVTYQRPRIRRACMDLTTLRAENGYQFVSAKEAVSAYLDKRRKELKEQGEPDAPL